MLNRSIFDRKFEKLPVRFWAIWIVFFSNWILRVWICFCHRAIFLCWSTTKKGCYTQSRVLIFYDRRRVARYYRETHGLQRLWFFGNGWLLPKLFEIGRKTIKIQNSECKIGPSEKFGVRCYFSTVYMVRGKHKMRYFTDLVFKCFKICGFIWLPRYSK